MTAAAVARTDEVPGVCPGGCGRPLYGQKGVCEACYRRNRSRQLAYGRVEKRVLVSSDAARERATQFLDLGLSQVQVAQLAAVSQTAIHELVTGEVTDIHAETEEAILSLEVPTPGQLVEMVDASTLVPILGACRRIQALVADGHPQREIAEALSISVRHLAPYVERPSAEPKVKHRAGRDLAIRALFDAWQLKPGTSEKARKHAQARGWSRSFEWDEASIDDPAAKPLRGARWSAASTWRENRTQVDQLSAQNLTDQQIAEELRISPRSVSRIKKDNEMRREHHDSLQVVIEALERTPGVGLVRQQGDYHKCNCPVHEADGRQHTPSLTVRYDRARKKTWVKCWSLGCEYRDILDRIGLRPTDLYDEPLTREPGSERSDAAPFRPRPRQQTRAERAIDYAGLPLIPVKPEYGEAVGPTRVVQRYDYQWPDGTSEGRVLRKETPHENGTKKDFHQLHWNGSRWKAEGFERIPYRLPVVAPAVAAGETIFVCEGEKDCDTAERAGLIATTNAGGARSWKPEHAEWLRGAARVVIVVDHDSPGYRRGELVHNTLKGLVDEVRIVKARTGKDLTDHLMAGHTIEELDPVPHLDPVGPTPLSLESSETAEAGLPPPVSEIAATPAESETSSPDQPDATGGTAVATLAPSLDAAPAHDDTVDTMGRNFTALMQKLMHYLLMWAQRTANERRKYLEEMRRRTDAERAAAEAAVAVRRKTAETRLMALAKAGYDNANRMDLATAVRDAAEWAPDSEIAAEALNDLRTHLHQRYDITLGDPAADLGAVAEDVADSDVSQLVGRLQEVESRKAGQDRLTAAQEQMVAAIAQDTELDESTRRQLFAQVEEWKQNPNPHRLDALTTAMKDAGVGEEVRTRLRFVALYLGAVPGQDDELRVLRKLEEPLVDPGEAVKPKVDRLLLGYQDRRKLGADTKHVRDQIRDLLPLLSEEDQQKVKARGDEIRTKPTGEYAPLWPKHVDRGELADELRVYAQLAPQAAEAILNVGDGDNSHAGALQEKVRQTRSHILQQAKAGEGLTDIERIKVAQSVQAIDAGDTELAELLFADHHSGAEVDQARTEQQARQTAHWQARQLNKTLETKDVPDNLLRISAPDRHQLQESLYQLASGQWSLADFEYRGADVVLEGRLIGAHVPQHVRHRVVNQMTDDRREATTLGQDARQRRERWEQRIYAGREPQGYDSEGHRAEQVADLHEAGLSADEIRQAMAARSLRGVPPSEAVQPLPGNKKRKTKPGWAVHRATHRSGPDEGVSR